MAQPSKKDIAEQQRQDRLMAAIERPFRLAVIKEKNRFIEEVAKDFYRIRRISDDEFAMHKVKMENIFLVYYGRAMRTFSIYVERQVLKQQKNAHIYLETKADFWEFMLNQWVSSRGGQEARQTASTTRRDIMDSVQSALDSDEAVTESQLTKRVLLAKGFSNFRAAAIARTETHNAAMFASINTAKKIGADVGLNLFKRWIPVQDGRTRDIHIAMSGSKAISMDAKFVVGGARMDRPGDPAGGARNVINCRCALVYELQD